MQRFSAPASRSRPRLLVLELWGLGDVALAIPFLQAATRHAEVSLLAKPHAAPLLARFCPDVNLVACALPWTAHRRKYELHRWPWPDLLRTGRQLRARQFDAVVSARPDPREHALMALTGAVLRAGFSRRGSGVFLTDRLFRPHSPHRADYWHTIARHFGWTVPPPALTSPARPQRVLIHTGAAQPTRQWPRPHFDEIAARLRAAGHAVIVIDENSGDLDHLINATAGADCFIGNDSGPGHVAALLGVPTFTIFGAQLARNFHPVHPGAAWIDGEPCPYKPCHDYCRFPEPFCIRRVAVDRVWARLFPWLENQRSS